MLYNRITYTVGEETFIVVECNYISEGVTFIPEDDMKQLQMTGC